MSWINTYDSTRQHTYLSLGTGLRALTFACVGAVHAVHLCVMAAHNALGDGLQVADFRSYEINIKCFAIKY